MVCPLRAALAAVTLLLLALLYAKSGQQQQQQQRGRERPQLPGRRRRSADGTGRVLSTCSRVLRLFTGAALLEALKAVRTHAAAEATEGRRACAAPAAAPPVTELLRPCKAC